MSKKVLVVLTSHEKFPNINRPTGLWLGEAVHFVQKMEAAGYQIDFVSPRGGYTPIDPASLAMAEDIDWEWYQNKDFMNRLGTTLKPEDVDPDEYEVIYYAGGHGDKWDFPDNERLQQISRRIYESGGIVSSVCHGACGLLNIKLSDGKNLIAGKEVTGFSDAEEKMIELDDKVPFSTEDELVKRGASYRKAEEPFTPFAVISERVVTGQNPQSGGAVAEKVLELLHT